MLSSALASAGPIAVAALESTHIWRADRLARRSEQDAPPVLPSGHASLDAQLPGGGWPTGALIELLQEEGTARFDWQLLAPALITLLARHDGPLMLVGEPALQPIASNGFAAFGQPTAARVGRSVGSAEPVGPSRPAVLEPFGPALIARGLPAGRLLWARTDALGARLWAVEQALRCASVAAVLAWLPARVQVAALRRLQLAAQASAKPLFVLRPASARQEASPAPLRLLLSAGADGAVEVDLFKRRGPPLLQSLCLATRSAQLTVLLRAASIRALARRQAAPAAATAAAPAAARHAAMQSAHPSCSYA